MGFLQGTKNISYIQAGDPNMLLLDDLPHLHPFLPDNLHQIHPALPTADINYGGRFGDSPLQELLTAGVVNGKGALGGVFDGDLGGCWVGINVKGIDGSIMVVNSNWSPSAICGFKNGAIFSDYIP